MEREFVCIQPEYVKHFQCDGTKCGSKCCQGWQIDIDRGAYEKYAALEDAGFRKEILSKLRWNEGTKSYRMEMRGVACPMLREDRLCGIQRRMGEAYLSDTCAEFPRRSYLFEGIVQRALSLTCPVASRLALLDEKPMALEQITLRTGRSKTFFRRTVEEMPAREFLFDLQIGGIAILQDRRFAMNERLLSLGFFLQQADRLLSTGRGKELATLPEEFVSGDVSAKMAAWKQQVQFQPKEYLRMMFALLDALFEPAIVYFSEQQRNFAQYIPQAFRMTDNHPKAFSELLALYGKHRKQYERLIAKPYGHVLENYLVHVFFNNFYPCRVQGSLLHNYFLFLTLYKFFEFDLICMTGVMGEKVTLDDMLELIERMSNRTDHASIYQEIVLGYLKEPEQNPPDLMGRLLDM